MTFIIVTILLVGYVLIATEQFNKLNKSSVAMFLGVMGWVLYMFGGHDYVMSMHPSEYLAFLGGSISSESLLKEFISTHIFMSYVSRACEVIFFILATSSIIEVLHENDVFDFMAEWIRTRSSKKLLWALTILTFFLSANIDNLTTAVTMVLILRKLIPNGRDRLYLTCSILFAANAGGCFTAIGDTTSLILWTKEAITPSAFAGNLFVPSFVAMLVVTYLTSFNMPQTVVVRSALATYRGDGYFLSRWQRMTLFIVGICGLWSIPTFHSITRLPAFVGALCCLSLLWLFVQIFNRKKASIEQVKSTAWDFRNNDVSQILFFIGISLAVGAIVETGAMGDFADYLDKEIHNIYILTTIFGFVSSIFDNIPLVLSSCAMYDVVTDAATGYASAFEVNGDYWNLIALSTAMGGSLLTIGSVAGFAVASLERIPFWWYLYHYGWIVLVGWASALMTYYLMTFI